MKMFNIDDVNGSTHNRRSWNTTEKLMRTDHVIVHTGWQPFINGNTTAYGVGYISDISKFDDEYSVEWLDKNGEVREGLAWIPREYIEKVNRPLDFSNTGDIRDEEEIDNNSDPTTLLKLYEKMSGKTKPGTTYNMDPDDDSALDF